MKLVKIFGAVMAVHAAVFMFVFAIPGCRSTSKKPVAAAPSVETAEASPLASSSEVSPIGYSSAPEEVAPIRFSPTRPGTPTATAAIAAPEPTSYTVVKGDSLWSIAKKNGLTVKDLTAANKLRSDATLQLGQKLIIPAKAVPTSAAPAATASAAPTAAAPASSSTSSFTHTVKAGETLGGIAKKYQTKVGEIATANNIADPTKIRVGQTLKIPGWQAPASKPATVAAPAAPAPTFTPAPAPVAPIAPLFTSPVEAAAPLSPATESPFITPAAPSDAPLIRVEESGAPRIE
jgi:LysM repeat protein